MRRILIGIAMIVIVAFLIGPAAAHFPSPPCACDNEHHSGTCPEGETCGVTGTHEIYGSCQSCPSEQVCTGGYANQPHWKTAGYHDADDCRNHHSSSWCNAVDHNVCQGWETIYTCHETGYAPCDGAHHEKKVTVVSDYGCIATSCPAIPCEEGFHCTDETCVPDVCGVDFTCPSGSHCEGNICVQDPQSGYWPAPFTTNECGAFLGVNRPMDDLDPATLPMLNLKNTLVRLEAVVPQGMNDCVGIAWYGNGETSYFGDTPHVEYYNLQQLKEVGYGQDVVVQAKLPVQAVCLLVVKDEICDSATMEHIIVTDSHGTIGLDLHTTQRVYQECFQLPKDFQGWRPTTDTMLFSIF